MKYLHKFTSMADFQAAYDGQDYIEPWVSYTTYDQALSFTASIIHAGNEFGPYDFTFYEEVDHLGVSLTNVTGTFYIWSYDNGGSHIVTTTRNITENTYYEDTSWVEGSGYWTTSGNVGDSGYTLVDISSVVNETKGVVDYNKQPVDWDFELVWHSADTCGYQELTNFSSRVGFEEVDSSIGHWYHITGQDFTTNPISSFKVKISNCPGYDGVYTVTGDNSGQGTNEWWWTGPEGSFSLQVTVEQNNNVAKLYADFTEGC